LTVRVENADEEGRLNGVIALSASDGAPIWGSPVRRRFAARERLDMIAVVVMVTDKSRADDTRIFVLVLTFSASSEPNCVVWCASDSGQSDWNFPRYKGLRGRCYDSTRTILRAERFGYGWAFGRKTCRVALFAYIIYHSHCATQIHSQGCSVKTFYITRSNTKSGSAK
jgi:hypothetical protein